MAGLKPFRDAVIECANHSGAAILFEDSVVSYPDYLQACADRAAFLLANRNDGPLHVGVLLDNIPEFPMWLGATALAGGVVVGINPTLRGAELARDIRHTDCQLIVSESRHLPLLGGLDTGVDDSRIFDVESDAYARTIAEHAGASIPAVEVRAEDTLLLLFTSGTSGAPKAVICSQGKLHLVGQSLVGIAGLDETTVSYQVMPMFHSNGLFTGFAPTLIAGGTMALRRKFSASGFIEDVRKFRATYFNYVGKPLTYILATQARADDANNTLKFVFGNEAADLDIARFSARFGVEVKDGYGSSETGASISRTDDMPAGALGVAAEGTLVLDAETGSECPPAEFDAEGRLLNSEHAIGEIVNTVGRALFEGYYRNDEADAARMKGGMFWTGDLAYRDKEGYFYFAGRDFEWLRVDGENFAAAPVERILARFAGVELAAVYAVPDSEVGDQVMAALQMSDPEAFDASEFSRFLASQSDLGTKWTPRYVRLTVALPITHTSKVMKRELRAERWECDETVYYRSNPESDCYRPIAEDEKAAIRSEFERRGRGALIA